MRVLEEGCVIGNYRVIRLLGQGGMGTVYEVEHVELGVRYALKTFTFNSEDDAAHALKTKFLEEGKVLARLKHPNIAHVFDLAFDEQSQMPYFVMDLVTYEDGESYTAEDVELSEIDEELAYQWFKEVASALDYIHGEGIVHRDIKPGNLLLGKDLHVVLTDFGISRVFGKKMQGDVEAQKTMVSKTGRGRLVMGTEKYIAPEVAQGEEATPAADAYALGVMALRWLTGFYYSDNPGCIALLAHKKYKWLPVVARLVAPVGRRPDNLSALVKQLQVKAKGEGEQRKEKSPKKKSEWGRAVLIAFFVLLGLCGVAWFGYQGWLHYEADKKVQRERYEEIQRQLREKEEAEKKERAEAEAKRVAEEKRIAEEKEAKRKAAEEKRRKGDEARVKIAPPSDPAQTNDVTGVEIPIPPSETNAMVIVTDTDNEADAKKDYGPIPNKTYKWLVGGTPMRVDFQMANGAKIEMLPMKKGVFYMSNNWDDKKARHKVTLARPFWMSKFCVTAEQWREFAPNDCEDCREVEKSLGGKYPLYKGFSRRQIDSYCDFLTKKYRSQMPVGYVFRLPTEAEYVYAQSEDKTLEMYRSEGGIESLRMTSEKMKTAFGAISKQFGLGRFGEWDCGWLNARHLQVGGVAKPFESGVCDLLLYPWSHTLDTVKHDGKIRYSDEEQDPLYWAEECDIYDGWHGVVGRHSHGRIIWNPNDKMPFHLVLGPDLIGEKAWENPRKNVECNAPVPNRHYAWERPDKVLKIIKKPKELTFKMAEGGDMIFCTVPIVNDFNMSNPDGQDKLYHKVTLTKPFWITKYCVTTKQWREYAKYDCEGVVRDVEKCFRKHQKHPIYMSFTRPQWDGFCEYLNKRYGHQLPKGYVFRLPTDAEWEWAYVGDKKGDIRGMLPSRFSCRDDRFRNEFAKLLKKCNSPKALLFDHCGWIENDSHGISIGGIVDATDTFGVCDMVTGQSQASFAFDTFDAEGEAVECCRFDDREIDPVRWAGRLTTKFLSRGWGAYRWLFWKETNRLVARPSHIVVGPDIETPLKKKELEPFPTEDFGGKLLSDVITNGGQSSKHPHKNRFNTPDKFNRMISTENTLLYLDEHKDADGFYTDKEDSPWIQLNLDKRRVITGLQMDALDQWAYNCSRHLRVWTSEDGKTWHEVAKENQRKHRYRFDLQRKNVTAKYIRIGREPGFMKDHFSLDKILVYGKEK